MQATLERLKCRYKTLVDELSLINGDHPLNLPEVKTQDGGTTLEKGKKIKQLEDSIVAAAKAIKDHIALCETIDAGSVAPWTLETQLEL
jgi:hypothetical protein